MFGKAVVSVFETGLSALVFESCPTGFIGAVGALFKPVCGLVVGLLVSGLATGFWKDKEEIIRNLALRFEKDREEWMAEEEDVY